MFFPLRSITSFQRWHSLLMTVLFLTTTHRTFHLFEIQVSSKPMNPNIENIKSRPDNTALSIQRSCPPSRASTESSRSSSPSLMDNSLPSECDYAEQVAAQNNMDIMADNTPSTSGSLTYDFATRERLIPPLLTTSICHWNPPHPQSFLTVLTSQPTLTCGMATSQPHHYLALMNSCKAMFAIWHAHYNIWHASSNSVV